MAPHHTAPAGQGAAQMVKFRNLVEVFEQAVARRPGRPMLRGRRGGIWRSETFADWRSSSELWARGLVGLGMAAGDRVAILGETSPDWLRADMAVLMAGGVTVGGVMVGGVMVGGVIVGGVMVVGSEQFLLPA